MSATRDRARSAAGLQYQLAMFVVTEQGSMIAVYNGAKSCFIKTKTVDQRDWRFRLLSRVNNSLVILLILACLF